MKKKRGNKKKIELSAQTLLSRYRDPLKPGSLGGLTRFAKANNITIKRAREVHQLDLGYTLHKPRRRQFPTLPVMVYGFDEQWTEDLIEVNNIAKCNRGYSYLLTMVDVFSKHAWVEPVKNKTGKTVTVAMTKILKRSEGRKPINLQTDDEKEFYNKTFQDLMKRKHIHHFSTSGDTKSSVIERFNRTLKQRIYRYFTSKNTLNFVDGYTRSYHRSIKMAPNQVNQVNRSSVWKTLYGDKKASYDFRDLDWKSEIGSDLTRSSNSSRKVICLVGPKRCLWSVVHVEEKYLVQDRRMGWHTRGRDVLRPRFETLEDDGLFHIEKIVKRKGNKLLVRWKSWPDTYDTWLDKGALKK